MTENEARPHDWPETGRLRGELLRNMERYITAGEEVTRIRSYANALRLGGAERLPFPLRQVVSLMASRSAIGGTIASEIDDSTAQSIWREMTTRAPELSGEEGAWQAFSQMAALVAEGMAYPSRVFEVRQPLTDEDLTNKRGQRVRQWLEGIELLLVSGAYLRHDFRSVTWLARQPLRRGFRGLCRHYSLVVQVLFEVMKRTTGKFRDSFVLTVGGYPSYRSLYGHAWTWYVNAKRNTVVALDLTGADWLVDRGGAESIFNKGFDATGWNNVSAFVSELFRAYAREESPTFRSPEIAKLLPLLIEPETVRGRSLLYNLCYQPGLQKPALESIKRYLEDSQFGKVFPGWKRALAMATVSRWRWLTQIEGGAEAQSALLSHLF